jgi:quercetin dioxygenase-like cupin family protein
MTVILPQAHSKNKEYRVNKGSAPLKDRSTMQKSSLTATVRQQLRAAQTAAGGRSAHTDYGGHDRVLRQAVIALLAGQAVVPHENPIESPVQVLQGRVRIDAGQHSWEGLPGDLLVISDTRHTLTALVGRVVLLTVARR